MKNATHTLLAAGFAMLVNPAHAIEAPPDDVPSIKAPRGNAAGSLRDNALRGNSASPDAAADDTADDSTIPSAYLGVGGGPVPEVLAVHIGLKAGEGVVVTSLDPEGPAAKAGFTTFDVILRADGKALASHADLTATIRQHKPGDELAFDLIHQGKAETRRVVLDNRPESAPRLNGPKGIHGLDHFFLGMQPEQAKRFRESIERSLGAGGDLRDLGREAQADAPELEQKVREMQKRVERMLQGGATETQTGPRELNLQNESTFRLSDEKGSIELKSKNGAKDVRVLGKKGEVVWAGPWETEADKAAAPAEVRQRIDALNIDTDFQGKGLRLRLGSRSSDDLSDQ